MQNKRVIVFLAFAFVLGILGVIAVRSVIVRSGKKMSEGKQTFVVADGCEVADLTDVHEGYSENAADGYTVFTINVSAPKIPSTFLQLAQLPKPPVFFTIEVGTHRDVETTLRKTDAAPFHEDVYYLDGLSQHDALKVFGAYDRLLSHDGGVKFGIGSHATKHDEVFLDGYKVFHVYTTEPEKYRTVLATLGFRQEPKLKTVWQTFTRESPGKRGVLKGSPKTIWEMVEELKKQGLYLAERRED
jgi:hypothetical protein